MAKKLSGYDRQFLQELSAAASNAASRRRGTLDTCTIQGTSPSGDRTASKTASGCAEEKIVATRRLTVSEITRLQVIQREFDRGFYLTMNDIEWLLQLVIRAFREVSGK